MLMTLSLQGSSNFTFNGDHFIPKIHLETNKNIIVFFYNRIQQTSKLTTVITISGDESNNSSRMEGSGNYDPPLATTDPSPFIEKNRNKEGVYLIFFQSLKGDLTFLGPILTL